MTEDTLRDQVAAALCNLGIGHYRGWDHAEAEAVMPSYHEQTADALLAAVPALSVPGGLAEAAGAYLIAIDKWRGRQEAVLAESDAMVWRRAVADAEKALRAALSGDVAKYGWHGNGDLCLGPECGVVDEYGDHPMADVHSNDWYVGYAAGQRDRAALAQRAPERGEALDKHPEGTCGRCGGPNLWSWCVPSPLWNAVMRERGEDWSIVCPQCFEAVAIERGVIKPGRVSWRIAPDGQLAVHLPDTDRDGRVWDDVAWLWRDRAALAQRAPERSELRATEKASSDDGLAVPAATPGLAQALDVERLAQALANADLIDAGDWTTHPAQLEWARQVAAEYARLAVGDAAEQGEQG